jgi:uncharacterized membrane protein YgcG
MNRLGAVDVPQSADAADANPASTKPQVTNKSLRASLQFLFRAVSVAVLAALCLLFSTGCTSLKVKMGWKVYLAKTPVSAIDAKLAKGPGIAPGQKSPLIVTVAEPDGKVLQTEGAGKGKVMWKDLQVTGTIVTINQKGIVSLRHDPRVSDNKIGHITVTAPSHPELRADLDIPFRYDIAFVSNFSGAHGQDGMNGMDGTDGTSGSSGSTDPNNPSPGGDGGNGSDGSNGSDGGSGGDAPPVQVRLTLRNGAHPLIQASVSAKGKQRFYLIDPRGGSLTVKADGGQAGSGGHGGRGGRGGSGGIGSPSGSDGHSGSDGLNGSDGSQGRGGLITLTYDASVKSFLTTVHLSSQNGPKPVFQEQAVAALW